MLLPSCGTNVICCDEAIMKEVSAYLEKPPTGNVFIHDIPKDGDLPITSRYRVLNVYKGAGPDGEDVSDIEVELVTGRTHQIRTSAEEKSATSSSSPLPFFSERSRKRISITGSPEDRSPSSRSMT